MYDAERQRQTLEQDGVVEQHRVDFDKYTRSDTCFEHKRLEEGKLVEYVPRKRTRGVIDESLLQAKTLVSNAVIVHTTAGSKSQGHFRAKAIVHNARNSTKSCPRLISENSVGATRHERAPKSRRWQTTSDRQEIPTLLPR